MGERQPKRAIKFFEDSDLAPDVAALRRQTLRVNQQIMGLGKIPARQLSNTARINRHAQRRQTGTRCTRFAQMTSVGAPDRGIFRCADARNPRRRDDRDGRMESADKPGSVEDDHSSGTAVTSGLKRPTRKPAGRRCGTVAGPAASLFGLAPGGVFRAAACYHPRGALLPHLFTLTANREARGGIFSVALSVGSRPPGVTWHPARRSPDFPPAGFPRERSPGRLRGGP